MESNYPYYNESTANSGDSNWIMLAVLIIIFLLLIVYSKKKPNSGLGKLMTKKRAPSLIVYCLTGMIFCFSAGVILFSKMFGTRAKIDNESDLAFYGFLSMVPGIIIGALFYMAKKKDYDEKQKQNIITFPTSQTKMDRTGEEKVKCPYCGEEILAVAKKCKHCGEWIKEK